MSDPTFETKFGRAKLNKYGYYQITTSKEGNHKKFLHRLIYEEYYGEIPEGYDIHHIDGNKTNNDITNLIALRKGEHMSLHNKGENHPMWNKHHSPESIEKMRKAQLCEKSHWFGKTGEDHPAYKNHPTIMKDGSRRGKRYYVLRNGGKYLKGNYNISYLLDFAKEQGFNKVEVLGLMTYIE